MQPSAPPKPRQMHVTVVARTEKTDAPIGTVRPYVLVQKQFRSPAESLCSMTRVWAASRPLSNAATAPSFTRGLLPRHYRPSAEAFTFSSTSVHPERSRDAKSPTAPPRP